MREKASVSVPSTSESSPCLRFVGLSAAAEGAQRERGSTVPALRRLAPGVAVECAVLGTLALLAVGMGVGAETEGEVEVLLLLLAACAGAERAVRGVAALSTAENGWSLRRKR